MPQPAKGPMEYFMEAQQQAEERRIKQEQSQRDAELHAQQMELMRLQQEQLQAQMVANSSGQVDSSPVEKVVVL